MNAPLSRGTGEAVRSPIKGLSLFILVAVLLLAQTLDGMDMNALAFVGVSVRKDLALSRAAFGACIGAAFFGTAIGAAMFGGIADRIGRRKGLLMVVAAFGLLSLATSQAGNSTQLVILRGLTGLALGGLLPIASALLIGNVSASARTTAVTIVTAGSAGGTVLAGFMSSFVVPSYGWRAVFVLGGLMPLIIMPLLLAVVPADRVRNATARIDGVIAPVGYSLFHNGAWRVTLLLWAGMFFAALPVFVTVGWLPSLIEARGASLSQAAFIASLFSVGGAFGGIVAGNLADRFRHRVILPWAVAGAILIAAIGAVIGGSFIAPIAGMAGFLAVGLITLMGALAGQYYSDAIRGLGVGLCLATMRIGAAVAPWGAGKLLDLGAAPSLLFLLCGGFAILSGLTFASAGRLGQR